MRIDATDILKLVEKLGDRTRSRRRRNDNTMDELRKKLQTHRGGNDIKDFFEAYVLMNKLIDDQKEREKKEKEEEKKKNSKPPEKKPDVTGMVMFLMIVSPIISIGVFGWIALTIAEIFSKMPK